MTSLGGEAAMFLLYCIHTNVPEIEEALFLYYWHVSRLPRVSHYHFSALSVVYHSLLRVRTYVLLTDVLNKSVRYREKGTFLCQCTYCSAV